MKTGFKMSHIFFPMMALSIVALGSCGRSHKAVQNPDAPQNGDAKGDPKPTATPEVTVAPQATVTPEITATPVATPEATPIVVLPHFEDINSKVFQTKCARCHNSTHSAGEVDLSSYDSIKNSVVFPPLIIPFAPEKSNIFTIVRDKAMPKGPNKLSPEEISAIEKWIAAGAKRNETDPDPTPVPIPTEPPD